LTNIDLSVLGGAGLILTREDLPDYGRQAARQYREMRDNDALLGGIFFALESLFRRVQYTETPAPKPDGPRGQWTEKRAAFWASYVGQCREDMSHTWPAFIAEVLTSLEYGFAPFEICWKYRIGPEEKDPTKQSRYTDGRVGWRKFAIRQQTSVSRWEMDQDGGIQGFWQYAGGGLSHTGAAEVFIPISKALLFRTTEAGNNPEGRSLLRNSRRAYFYRQRIQEFEAVGVERDLAGLPHMEVPTALLSPDASDGERATLVALQRQMSELRNGERAYIITPAEKELGFDERGNPKDVSTGYRFRLVSSAGGRAHDTNAIIRRYTSEIATSLLATFLLLGGDGNGAQALSKDLTELFELAGTGILDGIVATINRFAVEPLMLLNGVPPELWPTMGHGGLSDEALQAMIGTVNTLLTSGGLTADDNLEAHLRDKLKLPEKAEADPEETAEAPAPNGPPTDDTTPPATKPTRASPKAPIQAGG